MPAPSVANPVGVNGPRPGSRAGRLRNTLTNIASKQKTYPSTVTPRPTPVRVPGVTPPGQQSQQAAPVTRLSSPSVPPPPPVVPVAAPVAADAMRASLLSLQSGLGGALGSELMQMQALLASKAKELASSAKAGGAGGNDSRVSSFLGIAKKTVGDPYVFANEGEYVGGKRSFDCSGLVYWALNRAGVKVDRLAADGYKNQFPGVKSRDQLRPGDLIYYWYPNSQGIPRGHASHIEIYLGHGKSVGADNPSEGVRIESVDWGAYIGGSRVPGLHQGGQGDAQQLTGGGPRANRRLGRSLASQFGWTGKEWEALDTLWGTDESGWRRMAKNPSSGAAGIPQRLGHGPLPEDWWRNARKQIMWGLRYIKGRYGSPLAALAHENARHWY